MANEVSARSEATSMWSRAVSRNVPLSVSASITTSNSAESVAPRGHGLCGWVSSSWCSAGTSAGGMVVQAAAVGRYGRFSGARSRSKSRGATYCNTSRSSSLTRMSSPISG